jgi:hypothetical protein
VLADEPDRARLTSPVGATPLWWLPDDETEALKVVEVLLAAGVDPRVRNNVGETAVDAARERGMLASAARLEEAIAAGGER